MTRPAPNKHGVYPRGVCERVSLYRDTWRTAAEILLVQTRAGWKFGIEVKWGGCAVGGGGFGHLPSETHGQAYPTRTAAEDAAREEIVRRLERKKKAFLPSTAAGVKRDINRILRVTRARRQMGLFGNRK